MAKEKMKSQRSYDDDGYMKRAACVCVKNEHENEVFTLNKKRMTKVKLYNNCFNPISKGFAHIK